MEAYCFNCKQKKEVKKPQEFVMKNGRRAAQGACQTCEARLFRILKKQENEQRTQQ